MHHFPPSQTQLAGRSAARLRLFCETYFKTVFPARMGRIPPRAIAKIQESILSGGLYALAFHVARQEQPPRFAVV